MKLPRVMNPLHLVLLLALLISPIRAGQHFCPANGQQVVIDISQGRNKDVTLVPEAEPRPGSISQAAAAPSQCSWQVSATALATADQLVILGTPAKPSEQLLGQNRTQDGSEELRYSVLQPGGQTLQETVFPGLVHVIHLTGSAKNINVSFNRNLKGQGGNAPVNLRFLLAQAGFCSRDMLSFHGNCHAVSPLPSNVTVSMSNIRGDAQLASFIMSQVKSFIAANEARRGVHPYRRALELSQAVRLGMFYSAIPHATILSVVSNKSGCVLQELLERPEEMLATAVTEATGVCGSLRVDESGRAVMEFGDCSKPMLSLMSFPETASSPAAAATECNSGDLMKLVKKLEQRNQAYSAQVSSEDSLRQHPPAVSSPVSAPRAEPWVVKRATLSALMLVFAAAGIIGVVAGCKTDAAATAGMEQLRRILRHRTKIQYKSLQAEGQALTTKLTAELMSADECWCRRL